MMHYENTWKNRHFEILCRLNSICRDNGIRLFLNSSTALAACRDGELYDFPKVFIDIRDAMKLHRLVEADNLLGIVSMLNDENHTAPEFRITYPGSLDFSYYRYLKGGCCELSVRLSFICHIPDGKGELTGYKVRRELCREYLQTDAGTDSESGASRKRRAFRLAANIYIRTKEKLKGRGRFNADMFRTYVRQYSGYAGKVMLDGSRYRADFFDEVAEVTLCGETFSIPGRCEEYFSSLYGKNWFSHTFKKYTEDANRFRDGEHSLEDFLRYIPELDFDEYRTALSEYDSFRGEYEKYDAVMKHCYALLMRTHYRFTLWQKYMPLKEELLSLYEKKKYEQLEEILGDYLQKLNECRKERLGLCFDDDIFEIALDLLRIAGKSKKYIRTLRKLVPEAHRMPIRIVDYHGDMVDYEFE